MLAVHDLEKSASFYKDVLGFTVYAIDDPGWRFASKDHCLIMLGECRDAMSPGELGDHSYFAYLEVNDVDAYYEEVLAKGATIRQHPKDKPWGMREFAIETVDGHRIMIGQELKE